VRIVEEIYKRAVELVGTDFPIMIKYNGDDFMEGGIDVNEAKKIGEKLSKLGYAALEMKLLGLILGVLVVILVFPIILVFVIGIFLLIATVFLIAQLTGKPIEIKIGDRVVGHVQYFKYIPIEKKGLLYPQDLDE